MQEANWKRITLFRDGAPVSIIPRPRTVDMFFSPRNSFFVTWENYAGGVLLALAALLMLPVRKDEESSENMVIWETASGKDVAKFIVKRFEAW